MKIEYDDNLYKKIGRLRINDIVQVENRKGIRSTIHIQNITKLTWQELQLLVPDGANRFTKMVLLYNSYVGSDSESSINGERLTDVELYEISEYIRIFRENSLSRHYEVNQYISENCLWDNFSTIRSLNDHGKFKEIKGIQPKYFEIICAILGISGEDGLPLDSYKKY
jgi:hypothetical protein